jgi:class 3 adenylate cyclase
VSGENLRSEYLIARLKHELKQKKQAFAILTKLQREFTVAMPLHAVFSRTVKEINSHLSMDRSLILIPSAAQNRYRAGYWCGFPEDQIPVLEMKELELPGAQLQTGAFLLTNKSAHPGELERRIQKEFALNFFVGVPIMTGDGALGFIICCRQHEKLPYNSALDEGDADTLMAIAGLITSLAQNKKMMEMKLQMQEQLAEKMEIVNMFGQQVSKDVANALMHAADGKGARKKVAVMFLDIRNFTPFVQDKTPEETVYYLNALFGFMTEIIDRHQGIINQFLGDGFMTTFGAPVEVDNPSQNAVRAALEIHEALLERIASGLLPHTRIGIGIHGGEAVTGNVGSDIRKQYSITGKVVIIAARLEQFTKECNACVLISGDIKSQLEGDYPGKSIGDVLLKGMSAPMEVYQLI